MHLLMPDNMSNDERERIEAEYRAELEAEHTERQLAQERRQQQSRQRANDRKQTQQIQAEAMVKEMN